MYYHESVCVGVVINEVSALMRFGFEVGSKLAHQVRNGNCGCSLKCAQLKLVFH